MVRGSQVGHVHVATNTDNGRVTAEQAAFASGTSTGSSARVVRVLARAEERRAALERKHGLWDRRLDERNPAGLRYSREISSLTAVRRTTFLPDG